MHIIARQKLWQYFSRFHRILERNGQTVGQTDRQTEFLYQYRATLVSMLMRDKKDKNTHKLLNVNRIACLQPVCKKWLCVHSIVYNNQLVHNTAENSPHNNFSSSPPNDHRRSERRIMCNKRVSLNGDREPQALSRLFIRSTHFLLPRWVYVTIWPRPRASNRHKSGTTMTFSRFWITVQ